MCEAFRSDEDCVYLHIEFNNYLSLIMAYSDFTTLRKVKSLLGVTHELVPLFTEPIAEVAPSEHLVFDLKEAETLVPVTEKSKSELIIVPILKEVRRNNADKITYFSGFTFDVSPEKSLTGVCDFIFGYAPQTLEINTPVFCIIEAKNRTLEEGLGQCGAEMYAAQLYNTQEGEHISVVYGAVTNGYEWVFLKLENGILKIDTQRYTMLKIEELLGVFQLLVGSIV